MSVSIIGLGLKSGDLSLSGYKKIKSCDKVFIRSEKLSSGRFLKKEGIEYQSFDELFETLDNFDEVYAKIADRLESEDGDVCYLTDGSGVLDKVKSFLKKPYEMYPAAEKCAGIVNGCDYAVMSAYDFAAKQNFGGMLSNTVYITDLDNKLIASDVKLSLQRLLGDEEEVTFFDGKTATKIPLYELDFQKKYDYNSGVLFENKDFLHKKRFFIEDLLDIVTALRAPDGCPWDRAATHQSIRMNTIEEAYEVADAIDKNSVEMMIEETGDLMLQTVLHAEIGRGDGEYDINDVATDICQKLIDRHTHVFGTDKVQNASDALKLWDNNKQKLKGEKTATESIEHITKALPSIMYAEKVGKKAAKANFDFRNTDDVFTKIKEELSELNKAIQSCDGVEEELGDVLFSVCNLARLLGVEGELALTRSTQKFIARFEKMEELILNDGKSMKAMTDEELDMYYNKAKSQLK